MSTLPRVDSYSFGRIVIDGQTYTSDVIILPSGVQDDWRRDEGHVLKLGDLSAALESSPGVLVIGQGAYRYMVVSDETRAYLKDRGIEVVCAATAQAVKIYNERCRQDVSVAAALHLTC